MKTKNNPMATLKVGDVFYRKNYDLSTQKSRPIEHFIVTEFSTLSSGVSYVKGTRMISLGLAYHHQVCMYEHEFLPRVYYNGEAEDVIPPICWV